MSDERSLCNPESHKGTGVCFVCLAKKKVKDLGMGLGAEAEGEQIPRAMFSGSQGHVEIPRCKDCVAATVLVFETFSGFQMICYGKKPERKFARLQQDLAKAGRLVGRIRDLFGRNKGAAGPAWDTDHEIDALEALLAAAKNDEAAAKEALENGAAAGEADKPNKLKKAPSTSKSKS